MNKQIVVEQEEPAWSLTGDGLWSVGFTLSSLHLMQWLSGLVDVHEAIWIEDKDLLVFLVTNLDKTNLLFKGGRLVAAPLDRARPSGQGLAVAREVDEHFFYRGEN